MHQSTFPRGLCHLLSPISPASILLLGTLLALTTPILAQCGCRYLHLAMTDNRPYQYRAYLVGEHDTTLVGLFRDRAPQPFSTPPQQRLSRPHAWLSLPQFSKKGFRVEVTDSVTHQHMWLTFSYPAFDALEYAFLVDFAAGRHYRVALEQPGPPPGFKVTEIALSDNRGTHWLLLHKR